MKCFMTVLSVVLFDLVLLLYTSGGWNASWGMDCFTVFSCCSFWLISVLHFLVSFPVVSLLSVLLR